MSMDFHEDPIYREQVIARYLARRLNADQAEAMGEPLPGLPGLL